MVFELKGTVRPLDLFKIEMKDQYIEGIQDLILPLLEGSDMFLVNIRIKPTHNIKVYLDADSGISIGRCAEINRKLYPLIESKSWFPEGDFSLEVSSPGVDEPLVNHRQYVKNVGRKVLVHRKGEQPELMGMLKEVHPDSLVLELPGVKKKDPPTEISIPYEEIEKTIVQVIF